jgi:hypothetical protein
MTHDEGTITLTLDEARGLERLIDYRLERSGDCDDSAIYIRELAAVAEKIMQPFKRIADQKKRKELEDKVADLTKELNAIPS